MKIRTASKNIMKRIFLTLAIITIVSSISSARRTSRFNKIFFDPSKFDVDKDQEFSEEPTRVKRQSRSCPLSSLNCNNVPNVNRYRTIDGTCNNLGNPYCGAADTPFDRWMPRDPTGNTFRCPLSRCARPRDISFSMNNGCSPDQSDGITVMVMQWGQFIDHDLVFTPEEEDNRCCQDFRNSNPTSSHCVPIDVTGDDFYSRLSTTVNCLPFVRSKAANPSCTGSRSRETINERTTYLDASMVYGSTDAIANFLRTLSNGEMKVHGVLAETLPCPGSTPDVCPRSFLPIIRPPEEFIAGDSRVEEQPSLTSIHTLFIRHHNDIATNLKSFCSDKTDENIYQATRKIVGAIVQQITFNEFLPILLGSNIMNDPFYGPLRLDSSYSYDSSICTQAPNVFSTAAFRIGHSLIPNEFHLSNGNIIQLAESFNNHGVTLASNAFPSHFLGGIINQNAMPMDHMLVEAISNKLFAQSPFRFGSDLYARNIQRGRDHGIPGYADWFNACVDDDPSRTINNFNDLFGKMPDCVVFAFQNLYATVFDIELFPAGIAEFNVPGGVAGPTFSCIIAEHFADLKFGDRFWFQKSGVFSSGQVQSIRRTRLASLICLYTNVDRIQRNVMLPPSSSNPLTSCSTILQDGVLNDITTNIWSNYC